MVRPDLFLFGYSVISVDEGDKSKAADLLLKSGISATIKIKNGKGEFVIPYRKAETVRKLFDGKIDCSVLRESGLFPFILRNRRRYGVFVGALCFMILIFLSADTVWDVRIDGVEPELEDAVLDELSSAGLFVGGRWSKINRSQIEISALTSSENISWININRRGSVAYVKVLGKITADGGDNSDKTANIVASHDCVIEEIYVSSGYPMVKTGESVKAGDLLISGVIPSESGGGFCYAEGVIIGRYGDRVEAFVSSSVSEKVYYERQLISFELKIFSKKINIFKNHRQRTSACDIIEEKSDLFIFKKLPLCVSKIYALDYEVKTRTLSDREAVDLCSQRLEENLAEFLADKKVRQMKTDGGFLNDGYGMFCDVTVSSSIGKIQEFEVE